MDKDGLGNYVFDDDLAIPHLSELGWDVETVSWRKPDANWGQYDAVVIRTPWDYQKEPEAFLKTLDEIAASGARLANPVDICRWNYAKTYLQEIGDMGMNIVPTIWGEDAPNEPLFDSWQAQFNAEKIIVKPTVSATAEYTYLLDKFAPELTDVFAARPYMAQPFIESVVSEGEFSLFYFNGEYSHTILKTPKPKDFRVQEEHGGIITEVQPERPLKQTAEKILTYIGEKLLYARIDLVRDADGIFKLMELELIEPALYLRMNEGAPKRFAEAIDSWVNEL
jgi:hypothetical protein